jgi:Zn-dependent metalloprotease
LASFVTTTADKPLPVASSPKASAETRAFAFVDAYGKAFGLQDASQVQVTRVQGVDEVGMDHVRLQQVHKGIPVTAAELTVHLREANVVAVLAKTLTDLDSVDTTPSITPTKAMEAVQALLAKHLHVTDAKLSKPRLEIFNRGLLAGQPFPSRLAWFVEATRRDLRQFFWVDAHTSVILLHFSQLTDALNREVYDANSSPFLPGEFVRGEGDAPTGDADADNAYRYAGDTYNYFRTQHRRDSIDGTGAPIISTVHYCEDDCPLVNAFWNGVQMVYGDGLAAADDVVGHELTHAVTEFSANLLYFTQSGALNESYSDIFGESVDLSNTGGTDTPAVRWEMGEDVPGLGAIRDMMVPTRFGDPGKVSDRQFKCNNGSDNDGGGVHSNSGVPNHAYALMVDGGPYNGVTVIGIGLTKAAKIQYRALTRYLASGSDFLDNYNALRQSCTDLVGTAGITNANCAQVTRALQAVQMNRPVCRKPPEPPLCPVASQRPVMLFQDNLENTTSGRWRTLMGPGVNHWTGCDGGIPDIYCSGYATSGKWSFSGLDAEATGDSSVAMTRNVRLPATGTAYLYFNHLYEFETGFDGGVIEYSTNGGRTWLDARTKIEAGATYDGLLDASNPLGARRAFTRNSFGNSLSYTATRLNLTRPPSLANRNVRFRFRIGTDSSVGSLGWLIDDIRIYRCQ